MTEKMREKEKDRARVAKLVTPLKFFSAVVRLCCGSSQILESLPWFLLRIRSVLSKSDEMGLRNSDQIVCFVMWGSSTLRTALQIQVLWKFIYIVLLILAKISPWPYFFQDECKSPQILSKSSQNAPWNLRNPSEILPKSISDGTRSPLGDYVGPLIEKTWIFHYQKEAQRRPRAPKKSQNRVKFEVH